MVNCFALQPWPKTSCITLVLSLYNYQITVCRQCMLLYAHLYFPLDIIYIGEICWVWKIFIRRKKVKVTPELLSLDIRPFSFNCSCNWESIFFNHNTTAIDLFHYVNNAMTSSYVSSIDRHFLLLINVHITY